MAQVIEVPQKPRKHMTMAEYRAKNDIWTGLDKQVADYVTVRDWLDSLRSAECIPPFQSYIKRFMGFVNKDRADTLTPDDIVGLDEKQVKLLCKGYVVHLKKIAINRAGKRGKTGEISVNSVPTMMGVIKSWLEYSEVALPWWKQLKRMYPEKVTSNLRAYSVDEIAKMLDLGDPFDRLNIALFKASGERVGGQEGLMVENVIELPEGMGLLSVYPGTAHHYTVPLDPEAMFYFKENLKYRMERGERVTPQSPLIRDKFRGANTNSPKSITRGSIRVRIKVLMRKAGIPAVEVQPTHSFRYFFNTAMMNSDCKWEIKELMMGHSVKLEKYYYDEKNPESRKKLVLEYMKGMNSLIVTERFKMTDRIKQLEREVKDSPDVKVLQSVVLQKSLELDAAMHELSQTRKELENRPTMDQVRGYVEEVKGDFALKYKEAFEQARAEV